MSPSPRVLVHALVAAVLCVLGGVLWLQHLRAWDLGGRSPVLGYDSAQYALAARELADHGRLATSFALPVELVRHAAPPWPLAVLQPGLVIVEAALFRFASPHAAPAGTPAGGDPREWLVLAFPLLCFLGCAVAIAWIVIGILERHAPGVHPAWAALGGLAAGAMLALDPEAQHFAAGGFTELPFTLGLALAAGMLALGSAAARPFAFGLLLGATGTFRANMLWLAPIFALGAAAIAEPGRRGRVFALAIVGYALMSTPWWLYKWRAFGDPGWDLTRWVVWDGVEGRTWFSIYHLPRTPDLPSGAAAAGLLARKLAHTIPTLLLAVGTGPRALWLGALALAAALVPGPRALRVTAVVILAAFVLSLLAAAASIPWLRYVFPARIVLEVAGLFGLWALLAHYAGGWRPTTAAVGVAAALLALGWGAWQSARGLDEARETAAAREVPPAPAIAALGRRLDQELPPGEPVMSNLGPLLAWSGNRPVVHLVLAPTDMDACRRLLPFRTVVLVYREAGRAGPGWSEVVERPAEAPRHAEWNVLRARSWGMEGFRVVWLELGPLGTQVAGADIPAREPPGRISRPSL